MTSTASRKTTSGKVTPSPKTTRPRGYIEDYHPQAKTLGLLDAAQAVLEEYRAHWPLTIRQIFYRLIGAHGYPKTEAFYCRLCHHMANARRGRVIPFNAIRDDGVTTIRMEHFDDEDHFRRHVRELGENYHRNLMASQPTHVEVWCEAAGMIHQLAAVAHGYSIRVYSSSGFDSVTAKKDIAERICDVGKPAIILHLGDYDPSGESIFQAVAEDVEQFVVADRPWNDVTVEFRRVALTSMQVSDFRLPTAPAKASDSRSKSWNGETCQLEALTPSQIADLLDASIAEIIAPVQMHFDRQAEISERQALTRLLMAPGGAQ